MSGTTLLRDEQDQPSSARTYRVKLGGSFKDVTLRQILGDEALPLDAVIRAIWKFLIENRLLEEVEKK